ncbi:MAG TPA: hypothetical protein VN838_29820, partial [Bradyrhizobium sp.]|nr:hypothetical protein [Bradyrhizobium sp.]
VQLASDRPKDDGILASVENIAIDRHREGLRDKRNAKLTALWKNVIRSWGKLNLKGIKCQQN